MSSYTFTANVALQILQRKSPKEIARWCTPQIQNLGPVYVKLAQFLSVRRDLFDDDVIEELSKVQKECNELAMPVSKVESILRREHGDGFVNDLTIERDPLGIASLAQVHKGTSLSSGNTYAIKVLQDISERDIAISFLQLKLLAKLADLTTPNGHTQTIIKEYEDMLKEEMDYEQEAMNAKSMEFYYKDLTWVKIPEVVDSSPSSIIYEYVDVVPVDEKEVLSLAFDTEVLAKRVYLMYLKQLFEFDMFHADLHPGNLGIERDTGNIVMFDFGMTGVITPMLRDSLQRVATSLYTNDDVMLMYALQDLDIIPDNVRSGDVRPYVDTLMSMAQRTANNTMSPTAMQRNILKLPKDKFSVPSRLVFWFRSLAFVQAAVTDLNPDHDFETPLVQQLPNNTMSLESIRQGFVQAGNVSYKMERNLQGVRDSMRTIESMKQELTLARSMVQIALLWLLMDTFFL